MKIYVVVVNGSNRWIKGSKMNNKQDLIDFIKEGISECGRFHDIEENEYKDDNKENIRKRFLSTLLVFKKNLEKILSTIQEENNIAEEIEQMGYEYAEEIILR